MKHFRCSICNKRFASEAGCNAHIKDFHKKRTDGVPVVKEKRPDDGYMSEADYLIEKQMGF